MKHCDSARHQATAVKHLLLSVWHMCSPWAFLKAKTAAPAPSGADRAAPQWAPSPVIDQSAAMPMPTLVLKAKIDSILTWSSRGSRSGLRRSSSGADGWYEPSASTFSAHASSVSMPLCSARRSRWTCVL